MKHYHQFQHRYFSEGDYVFHEGDSGEAAYFIEEGQVEISTSFESQKTVLANIEAGGMFGELALMDGRPRSASAIATKNTVLTIVTRDQVKERIENADPLLRILLMVVTSYFRSETNHFRPKKLGTVDEMFSVSSNDLQYKIAEVFEIIRLEDELSIALNEEQFKLVFQPIVQLDNESIAGFEALLRWQSSRRGSVPPDVFIPVAESTALIIPLGEWVIRESFRVLKILEQQTNQELFVSINIASRQIQDPNLLDFLVQNCQTHGVAPGQVKLEIVERCLFNPSVAIPWFEKCRKLGFSISLDDFGTGYSSLAYIGQYKPNIIKIDKSLLDNFAQSKESRSICHAIFAMAKELGISTVAEGIESEEQAIILREMGCVYGQGYLFARPLSLEDAITVLGQRRAP